MKDLYKNPNLYYVLVPVLVTLWPLLVWAVYLPDAKKSWDKEKTQYTEGQLVISDILSIDPGRIELAGSKEQADKFEYAPAISEVASLCGISPANCDLSSQPPRPFKGQTTQSCHVVLKQIDIGSFAEFLSTLQLRWPALELDQANFTKKRGLPDAWKIDLDFKYYY
jgi:hypothetical protein